MPLTKGHSLIDVDDSILLVIDVQEKFLEKLPKISREPLVKRISWLVGVAVRLSVPVVVTAEDIANIGGTVPQIMKHLPPRQKQFDKNSFGVAGERTIMAELKKSSRRTIILTGLETDVCVAQSAVGLLEKNYRVAVVGDAVSSPGAGHELGLVRMREAGVVTTSVKGLYYEWLRTDERANEFRARHAKELGMYGVKTLKSSVSIEKNNKK